MGIDWMRNYVCIYAALVVGCLAVLSDAHVTCRNPGGVGNGYMDPNTGEYVAGSTITYRCQNGHILVGNKTRSCLEDGRWSGSQPRCDLKVTCSSPGTVEHGQMDPNTGVYDVDSVVTYRCQYGYQLEGESNRKCKDDGQWSGPTPKCVPNQQEKQTVCYNPGGIGNGVVEPNSGPYKERSVISYRCQTGFKLIGEHQRACQENGQWSGTQPRCEIIPKVTCPTPRGVQNGRFDSNGSEFIVDSVITYRCFYGYKVMGDAQRTCMDNGRWSGSEARCEREQAEKSNITCSTLGSLGNGFIEPSSEEYPVNSVVSFRCDQGYKLMGDAQRNCQGNGQWSGSQPRCDYDREASRKICSNPGGIGNGHVEPNLEQYEASSVISYRCENGYKLAGNQLRTCQKEGKWTGEQPRCEHHRIPCSSPGSVENGFVEPDVEQNEVDSIVRYRCRYRFELVGNNRRTCQKDGTWSGSQPRCKRYRTPCSNPGGIGNGFVEPNGELYEVDSAVSYRCQYGFQLVGEATRTCQANGQWSGSQPRCEADLKAPERQNCSNPGGLLNGLLEPNVAEYEAESGVSYRCEEGFRLMGDRQRKCMRYGQWSGSQPRCEKSSGSDGCEQYLGRNCDANAECVEEGGSYRCKCKKPFSGDGFTCSECEGGQVWRKCVSYCAPSCGDLRPKCGSGCDPNNNCKCTSGLVLRNTHDDRTCVRKSECK